MQHIRGQVPVALAGPAPGLGAWLSEGLEADACRAHACCWYASPGASKISMYHGNVVRMRIF